MQGYLVGGAVRDHLLGHPYHEKDYVVVGATPEQLLADGFQPVGKDFLYFFIQKQKKNMLSRVENVSLAWDIMDFNFIPIKQSN